LQIFSILGRNLDQSLLEEMNKLGRDCVGGTVNVNLFGLVWDFLTKFFCEFSVLEIEFFFFFFFSLNLFN
jgi:hypothetical protein